MHLYNLTLQKSQMITKAIYGQFSRAGAEEIVAARGTHLEVFVADEQTGKLSSRLSWNCFGVIRDIIALRLDGLDTKMEKLFLNFWTFPSGTEMSKNCEMYFLN